MNISIRAMTLAIMLHNQDSYYIRSKQTSIYYSHRHNLRIAIDSVNSSIYWIDLVQP